jgi:hypothetical protein
MWTKFFEKASDFTSTYTYIFTATKTIAPQFEIHEYVGLRGVVDLCPTLLSMTFPDMGRIPTIVPNVGLHDMIIKSKSAPV